MAKKADAKRDAGKRKTKTGAANRGQKQGQGALKAGSAIKHSNSSAKAGRTAPNGETKVKAKGVHYRSESTIKRLDMYNKKPNKHRMKEQPTGPARIQPDRRWFGNTRVISQDKMQAFRETVAKGVQDPFSVVLKSSKLPMSLLKDTEGKASRMDLLSIQPYKEVFSKKKHQKRVKLGNYDLESLVESADSRSEGYDSKKDRQLRMDLLTGHQMDAPSEGAVVERHRGEEIFNKGTSRRIWGELYKVVDASDVICFILDARDPMGTRNLMLEREIRKNKAHKHIVLVLNKVDLVPTWVSRRWIQVLMKDFPTLAFHASITNPFGKNALLNLLRQFSTLMSDKKHVTVGMIGFPNVGKSSVINTLKRKKVCKAAPVPGETRIWQYIALTKRLYLLDCPGIVPPTASDFKSDCAKVLKGVVRAERVEQPSGYIDEVLSRVKKQYLLQRYKMDPDTEWTDGEEFLSILANKMGKLFKGGDPDLDTTARIVLYDWQRGRIPFFTPPPDDATPSSSSSAPLEKDEDDEAAKDGATGLAESAKVLEEVGGAVPPPPDDDEDVEDDLDMEDDEPARGEASVSKGDNGKLIVKLDQTSSLSGLSCSLAFDDDDRQGEALPSSVNEEGATGSDKASAKAKAKGKAQKGAKAQAKRKADKKDEPAKKKLRRGGGGRGEGHSAGGDVGADNLVRPGSVDWGAVVAEFGN